MLQIRTFPTIEAMQHLEEVRGKFVQIVWKGDEWLLFASKDQHKFHNQIVAHFMSEQHLPFHWQSPEVLTFDQPKLDILGGGKFQLDWSQKQLVLSGESMVYGRFDEPRLRTSLEGVGMPWAGITIKIE